jgi:hypothetical protein
MKQLLALLIACFLLLFYGCNNKPPDELIDRTIHSFASRNALDYPTPQHPVAIYAENPRKLNEWSDENIKGLYYVDVAVDLVIETERDRRISSHPVVRFTFRREGNQWVALSTPTTVKETTP